MTTEPSAGRAGLLSPRAIAGCLLAALLLCWPMLLVTAPLAYYDSYAYASAGRTALASLLDALPLPDPPAPTGGGAGGGAAAAAEDDGGGTGVLRSAPWSLAIAMLGGMPRGAIALCILQTAATLLMLRAVIPAGALIGPALWVPAAIAVGLLTGLPWYAAYAMPDILGALVIGYYAALAMPAGLPGRAAQWVFAALAAFAIAAHYGHLPLAAGLAAVAALLRIRHLTLGRVALLAGPVVAAVLANLAVSVAVERMTPPPPVQAQAGAAAAPAPSAMPSATPRRLPILLGRAIEDGPGLWHLREACLRDAYATCDLFDEIPPTASAFLWGDEGIRSLSAGELAVLRGEEMEIVIGATRAYPLEQAAAFGRNVALQLARVGVDQVLPAPPPPARRSADIDPVLAVADRVVPVVTGLAALWLLWRTLSGRLDPALRAPLAILVAALAANALVYGGLSYPVDRYQGRLAWLIPALLALDLVIGRRTRRALA